MRSFKSTAATLSLLATLGVISGCAATGLSSSSTVSEREQVVNDLVTERVITRAIYDEPNLADDNIVVGCVNGVVTLGGDVDNGSERTLAENIARGVEGVVEVQNNLVTTS